MEEREEKEGKQDATLQNVQYRRDVWSTYPLRRFPVVFRVAVALDPDWNWRGVSFLLFFFFFFLLAVAS